MGYSSCPLGASSQSPPLPVIARTGGLTIGCFLSLQSYSWSGTISYFDHWWVLSLQSYSYSATIFNTLTIECSLSLQSSSWNVTIFHFDQWRMLLAIVYSFSILLYIQFHLPLLTAELTKCYPLIG